MLDQDAFGNWLSGFADGEGTFVLYLHRNKYKSGTYETHRAFFSLGLRADDEEILYEIQRFWKVGRILSGKANKGSRPRQVIRINSARELVEVVIPHFERYPLRSKKSRDFLIWRKGAELLYAVNRRGFLNSCVEGKWTQDERQRFRVLIAALSEQRKYETRHILHV